MSRKALRIDRPVTLLITLLATLALLLVAFAAQADDESEERHRRVHKIVIGGDGDDDHGIHLEHHGLLSGAAFFEVLGGGGGYLGVTLTELTPELRTHFGVPDDVGVMVSQVMEDSPAERAGVKVGDIISGVDSEEVGSTRSLKKRISSREDGEAVTLEVWRDGRMETLTASLEAREGMFPHRFFMDCEDDDCGFDLGKLDLDLGKLDLGKLDLGKLALGKIRLDGFKGLHLGCGDSEDCDLSINCDDGDCRCIVNGEENDCTALHLNRLHEHDEE